MLELIEESKSRVVRVSVIELLRVELRAVESRVVSVAELRE